MGGMRTQRSVGNMDGDFQIQSKDDKGHNSDTKTAGIRQGSMFEDMGRSLQINSRLENSRDQTSGLGQSKNNTKVSKSIALIMK